jgi:tRNA (mo5U34)-methyltransferase
MRARLESLGWWHSFELPDGTLIQGTTPLEYLRYRIAQFPIPDNLEGKRVLDIGAWDGWFSFEMERRGAEVLAIDVWDNPRFREIHSRLDSRVDYRIMDVYDLTPARVGRFDIVLFLGVLYHLKHPLLALERVCSVTTELAAVDSFVLPERRRRNRDAGQPVMEFYETDEFGGQTDNWVAPNLACLLAFCRTAGFARIDVRDVASDSVAVACYRRWDDEVDDRRPTPRIVDAFHNANYGINFSTERDDYVAVWFDGVPGSVDRGDVQPEVGGFGTNPIYVGSVDASVWQATFKLPPGLPAGWHPVRVRVGNGPPGGGRPIAVDVPLGDHPIAIARIADGSTRSPNQLDLSAGTTLNVWVDGLPQNADRANVQVVVGKQQVPVTHVERDGEKETSRQVTVEIPTSLLPGPTPVSVMVGSVESDPVDVAVIA